MEFIGEKAELIKEVHDYFRDKIVNGDYEVVKKEEITWNISIDGYTFLLWVSNGEVYFRTYHENGQNFMDLHFTVEQREKAWIKINKLINNHESNPIVRDKRKEFKRIKKELEELEN